MTLIRTLTEQDRPLVESWVAAEPQHPNNTFDWYQESAGKAIMFADDEGEVLVAKFTPCLRVDIDFSPTAGSKRIARVMTEGLPEMEKQAKSQGFKEFVFDSLSEKLVKFCERLGFRPSPDYRKTF